MKKVFDFLDKWLTPTKPVTGGEDAADSIVIFIIMALLLFVMFRQDAI